MHPHHELSELVLVRHAKSDWGDPSVRDHDRPLKQSLGLPTEWHFERP